MEEERKKGKKKQRFTSWDTFFPLLFVNTSEEFNVHYFNAIIKILSQWNT